MLGQVNPQMIMALCIKEFRTLAVQRGGGSLLLEISIQNIALTLSISWFMQYIQSSLIQKKIQTRKRWHEIAFNKSFFQLMDFSTCRRMTSFLVIFYRSKLNKKNYFFFHQTIIPLMCCDFPLNYRRKSGTRLFKQFFSVVGSRRV